MEYCALNRWRPLSPHLDARGVARRRPRGGAAVFVRVVIRRREMRSSICTAGSADGKIKQKPPGDALWAALHGMSGASLKAEIADWRCALPCVYIVA